ncbi:hypothetical protein KC19_6G015800 [Ceratodon purpureus]|uniref:Protein kinase domain-containing protein n=1 Tax=Ceratodon purpureus TaxID=3225 RepID=A0A8T0HD69_CERPU|nr:hypothetical protein KC19_6G015800 [Ceratodon purpureus]
MLYFHNYFNIQPSIFIIFFEDLAKVEVWKHFRASRGDTVKHCLAEYLSEKLKFLSEQSQPSTSNACSLILWNKQPRTWGRSTFLGAGSGTCGVYSTYWLGIPCARKQFHDEGTEPFFLKEASILAQLRHPHIINFVCCGNGKKPGDQFITMELMEKSLFKLIEDQKGICFSTPVAVDIIVQIAKGMCYLHDQNIAHRDLKPQNVVVGRLSTPHLEDHYCVKLVDFGVSKTKVEVSKSNTMTRVGIGTTYYRAPEVHPKAHPDGIGGRRKAIWFKADVFSFAMTCAHILLLKRPFDDQKFPNYTELIQDKRPNLPLNKYPQELIDLIKDCWNSKPRSRPSFLDIWIRLENFDTKL